MKPRLATTNYQADGESSRKARTQHCQANMSNDGPSQKKSESFRLSHNAVIRCSSWGVWCVRLAPEGQRSRPTSRSGPRVSIRKDNNGATPRKGTHGDGGSRPLHCALRNKPPATRCDLPAPSQTCDVQNRGEAARCASTENAVTGTMP